MTKVIPYSRQTIDDDDIAAVVEVLKSGWLTQGPQVSAFEDAMRTLTGMEHAVAFSSGTAALHAACRAAGIGPGDEIITSPITFAASANCARYQGAEVRFADIRADSYCLDPVRLKDAITPRTKAIVAVDFTGQPADLDEIRAIAQAHGVIVIEDAAHALGASYKGLPVGSISDMTIFSFHPVKHVAMGEGGLVTTRREAFANILRRFRTHGITAVRSELSLAEASADNEALTPERWNLPSPAPWYYEMQELGYNYRITDIQCALGLSQLRKLNQFLERRREIASRYHAAFSASPFLTPPLQLPDRQNAWHLYVLRLQLERMRKTRRQVFEELRAKGIGVHVHYIPLHLMPYYRDRYSHRRGQFPQAESYYDQAMTLPLFPAMTDEDVNRVIKAVHDVVS